jgi:hypothetical protein
LKYPISFIIDIIVADWGLISPILVIIFLVLVAWKVRKLDDGIPVIRKMLIILVNHYKGCMRLREDDMGVRPISSSSGGLSTSPMGLFKELRSV